MRCGELPCRIALIGNPNSGKTTVFNGLTGLHQKVGHWPGVTVEQKTGQFSVEDTLFELTDLPGIYALNFSSTASMALDEKITCHYLIEQTPDLIINVIDANNLERNLYLTLELLETGLPIVVALNMTDVAEKRKCLIDIERLQQKLGCPIIPLVGHRKKGLVALKKTLLQGVHPSIVQHVWPTYLPDFMQAARELEAQLPSTLQHHPRLSAFFFTTRLLEEDQVFFLNPDSAFQTHLKKIRQGLFCAHQMDCDLRIADARYEMIHQLIHHGGSSNVQAYHVHASDWIDRIVLNRVLGIPIFLFMMYAMFFCSMTLGGAVQPFFDIVSQAVIGDGLVVMGMYGGAPGWILRLLDAMGLGFNTILAFTPQIVILFFCLSLLERSGYMARAAFVMDRLMQWVGLPGKSFVPLIIGFGCNVPSIIAVRTLDVHRDRVITILMAPFMSCGARLAIFAVFSSAFFPNHGASVVFSLYLIGIIVALLTGMVMKYTLLRGEQAPFVMELPPYHWPMLSMVIMDMVRRVKAFLMRASGVILPFCVVIGFLGTTVWHGEPVLERVGKKMTPLFSPMGIVQENWPATVGLLTGTVAKEVVIGTLNTLYTQERTMIDSFQTRAYHPWDGLQQAVAAVGLGDVSLGRTSEVSMDRSAMGHMQVAFGSSESAFVYMLFVLLYVPCISTIAAASREAGKGWSLLSVVWSISIAYCLSVLCYQLLHVIDHPGTTGLWCLGIVGYLSCLIIGFTRWANHHANA